MKKGQSLWTREELILAMNLYCKLPFGKLHSRNPDVIELAQLLSRTPGSVAYKLVNLASLDPALRARGIKGATNASKLDEAVWNEFYGNWEQLPYESEKLLARSQHTTVEDLNHIPEELLPREGRERERIVKVRVNQAFFRKMVLASYNDTCCITGIRQRELLVAGHIRPWKLDADNRLNPHNGIALNSLHDRAFEAGLITITPGYTVLVSPILHKQHKSPEVQEYFLRYHNQKIRLPERFLPEREFLEYHGRERFKA